MEFIYENPDIAEILSKAAELYLLNCKQMTKITSELKGSDIPARYVSISNMHGIGIFASAADEPALSLVQMSEDTPENREWMSAYMVSYHNGLNIPVHDRVNTLSHIPDTNIKDAYTMQAELLLASSGNSARLGVYRKDSKIPLGWITLGSLGLGLATEFLRLGYDLRP